jgi:hypothetical protein
MHLKTNLAALTLLAGPALLSSAATAKTYYVAPPGMTQSCTANGSQACPWVGLGVLSPTTITGGDKLLLLDGNYGGLKLYQIAFTTPVVVQSLNAGKAHFDWINIADGSRNVTFRNLSVWPTDPKVKVSPLVGSSTTSSNIILDGLDVRGIQASANYMQWSQADWKAYAAIGAYLRGPSSSIKNSSFQGVYTGAQVDGADSAMIGNKVDGFAGDAYRILGDDSSAKRNSAQNCFQIDSNHADAIQSWADADGAISGLKIEANTFLEWTSPVANTLRCSLQGIGFFDGPYQNVVIRNNVVSVTQYHGISVYGGNNVKIVNNTVVNNKGIEGTAPWIGIFNHKNGTPAKKVVVANNLEMSIHSEVAAEAATFLDNSSLMGLKGVFTNIAVFDYRPTPASGFIDTADAAYAPSTDILGAARPYGGGPDRGAYEVGATSAKTSGVVAGIESDGTISGAKTVSTGAKFLAPPQK